MYRCVRRNTLITNIRKFRSISCGMSFRWFIGPVSNKHAMTMQQLSIVIITFLTGAFSLAVRAFLLRNCRL